MTQPIINRFEIQDNYIKGYATVEDQECEIISIPTMKGLYGMNMISMGDEALEDLITRINNSIKGITQ